MCQLDILLWALDGMQQQVNMQATAQHVLTTVWHASMAMINVPA